MLPEAISYDFPNADSLEQEFRLVKLEENLSYSTEKPHRHNYFELFYFIKGGGGHLIDFQEHGIHDLSLHMVPPGALHLVNRTAGSSGYVMLFTKAFLYSLTDFTPAAHLRLWREKPIYPLSKEENAFVEMVIAQIGDELEGERAYRQHVLASLLHMIFILMYRQAPAGEAANHSLAERFFDMLEGSFTSEHGASGLACHLGCSLKKLNRTLKTAGYPSAHTCLMERKMLEARRLLIHSDWSVKEISFHLNFTDPDYFGKVFKAELGESPTRFREINT